MKSLNETIYIFDVDGTLTEPRKKVTKKFEQQFLKWVKGKRAIIATGSDFVKTKEQLTSPMIESFEMIFCCMGNELRDSSGNIVYKNSYTPPTNLVSDLERLAHKSKYKTKTGNHIEIRTGMINFSTVGRNANHQQRMEYNKWDKSHNERYKLVNMLKKKYSNLTFSVGGSISIDIIPEGKDKGQCIDYILQNLNPHRVKFYGDRTGPGGNDYGIVKKLEYSNIPEYSWSQVEGPGELLSSLLNS